MLNLCRVKLRVLPAQGVFHSGGVLADATLPNQTPSGIRAALAPKLNSALLWERAVGAQPSTMHVTFSSVAALLGSPGQANYAAANAALDALAEGWQARGAAGLSIQWGAWAEGGMAAANAGTAKAVERMGMGMVAPEAGMGAMQALLLMGDALQLTVAAAVPFRWPKFMARQRSVPPMFEPYAAFWAGGGAASEAGAVAAPAGRVAPVAAAAAVSQEVLAAQVQEAVGGVLGSSVGGDEPLMAAGLDSLGTVELKNALERRAGMELPSTLVFDYPTVNALAGYLAAKLSTPAVRVAGGEGQQPTDGAVEFYHDYGFISTELQPAAAAAKGVVGISDVVSRSSGGVLLQLQPADESQAVPVERWDVEGQAELSGGIPVQFGVFLADVSTFDAVALSVSDTEAALMDPQQRMLLESVAEAALVHSAELTDDALRADWGVFVVSSCSCSCRIFDMPLLGLCIIPF